MRKNYDLVLDQSAGIHSPDVVLQGARSERDEALKRFISLYDLFLSNV